MKFLLFDPLAKRLVKRRIRVAASPAASLDRAAGGSPMWLKEHKEIRAARKDGEWNRITIYAKDNVVKTWVNGVPAAHWKNNEYLKGFFALQIHSGKQGKVLFDNIRIKELKTLP